MMIFTEILNSKQKVSGTITLTIDQRIRSRLKATLDDGIEVGIILPRGSLLRGGDLLLSHDSVSVIEVVAAKENVSTVYSDDSTELTKAAYHLGNRHIPLQVEKNWLRYQHDHVLDDMLTQMGLKVVVDQDVFEPEAGAYQQSPHAHSHNHSHSH